MQKLFGTSGIRGPASTLFTSQFCFDIGRVFGLFLKKHQQLGNIAVGIDSRISSPHIANSLALGLNAAGYSVGSLGTIPVPACHYAIISGRYVGSVMITGSHIDINSNGLKFFAFKEEINKQQEAEIEELYDAEKNQTKPSDLSQNATIDSEGINNYLNLLLSLSEKNQKRLKIVVDPGNGGQTEASQALLRELGHELILQNANIQEQLISRDTESDGAFELLQDEVKKNKADLGVGFDSDGDRIVFVDHSGEFIPGDVSGSIEAIWNTTDVVVVPINVSQVVEHLGKEIVRTKVGSPFVIEAMKKNGATFGFEGNGGCIHEDVMLSRDGGTTLVKMLNILHWSQKSLHELVRTLPRYHLRRSKFACPKDRYNEIIEKAKQNFKPIKIDETDGLKFYLDTNTWVLLRGSGNAPEFRVFVESNLETKANQIMQETLSFTKDLLHV